MRLGKTSKKSKEQLLQAEEQRRQEEKEQRRRGIEDEWLDSSITFFDMGQSFTSVASSVTSPPSYSGIAFAKYVQSAEDVEGSVASSSNDATSSNGHRHSQKGSDDGHSIHSDDLHRDNDVDATAGGKNRSYTKGLKKSKKNKKRSKRTGRRRSFFGSISEEELDIEASANGSTAGDESSHKQGSDGHPDGIAGKPPNQQRRRRRSLFGNRGGGDHAESTTVATAANSSTHTRSVVSLTTNSAVESVRSGSDEGSVRSGSANSAANSHANSQQSKDARSHKPRRRRSLFGSLTSSNSKGDLNEHASSHGPEEPARPKIRPTRRRSMFGGSSQENGSEDMAPASGPPEPSRHRVSRRRHSLTSSSLHDHNAQQQRQHQIPPTQQHQADPIASSLLRNLTADIHRVVNQERVLRGMQPFQRNMMLDTLASDVAYSLARSRGQSTGNNDISYHGNIGQGKSLDHIHATMMKDLTGTARKNILSSRFKEFGMALTKGVKGDDKMYLCQLFKL